MPCSRPFLRSIKTAFASSSDTMLAQVPCGKCPSCLKRKQRELAVRLQYDLQSPICYDHCFFTLTYAPENLEYNVVDYDTGEIFDKMPSVNKETIQKYLKRVRKALDYDPDKTQLYYYITGEYGAKKNPHYHGIIYLLGDKTSKLPLAEVLKKKWQLCHWDELPVTKCFQSALSEASNMYVAKHQVKRCKGTIYQAPFFQLRSKGIGLTFFTFYSKEVEFAKKNGFLYQNRLSNVKVPLPRYFADKLGLSKNYNNPVHLNEFLKRRLEYEKKDLHTINQYLSKRYYENPSLTQEQILTEYFHQKEKKRLYEDEFFDKMYVKLSETSNF